MNIFAYKDYREFLRDFYNEQKRKNKGYSYRLFARHASLASPNYLALVIEGKRRITDKSLPHFVKGLRLGSEEEKYFRALVTVQESCDSGERTTAQAEAERLRARAGRTVQPIADARTAFIVRQHHDCLLSSVRRALTRRADLKNASWRRPTSFGASPLPSVPLLSGAFARARVVSPPSLLPQPHIACRFLDLSPRVHQAC